MRDGAAQRSAIVCAIVLSAAMQMRADGQEIVTYVGGTGATTTSQQSWTQPGNWTSGSIPCGPTVWAQINPAGAAGSTLRILYSSTSLAGLTGTTNVLSVGAMTFPQTLVSASTTYSIQNNGTSAGTKGTLRFYGVDTTIGGQPRRVIIDNSTTLSDVAFTQTNQGQEFELNTSGVINVAAGTQLSLSTMVRQDGTARSITKVGNGVLAFAGTGNQSSLSTYTGGFVLEGGVVQWALSGTAASGTPFGIGSLTLRNGILRSTGTSGRSVNVSVVLDGTAEIGSTSSGLTGGITVNSAGGSLATSVRRDSVLAIADGQSTTWHQATTGSGGLTKAGGGTLRFSGAGGTLAHSGSTVVQSGTLVMDAVLASPSGATILAGAALLGSGTLSSPTTISGSATLSPGSGVGALSFGNVTWSPGVNYNWQIQSGTGGAGSGWDLASASGTLAIAATIGSPVKLNLWSVTGTTPDVTGTATGFDPAASSYIWPVASANRGVTGFSAAKFVIDTSAVNGTGGFTNDLAGGAFSVAQIGNTLALVFTSTASRPVITIGVSGTQTQAQTGWPLLSGTYPLFKTGTGTLVVDQANTITGSTAVQAGRLQLANAAALATSRVVPLAGGTVTLSPGLTTTVGGLDPSAGGLVDVGNGFVTVTAGLPAAGMLAALLAGRGDGSWNGTTGITSSAAADAIAKSLPRTVGWLDNGDGSVSFAFAASGDTNLDWSVDILDAANFFAGGKYDSGQPSSWIDGDFNYDGVVDILDAADFFSTGLFDAGGYNPPPAGGAVMAVPEPSVGLGCLAAVGILVCRCRLSKPRSFVEE
ncbi:MAG: autotransporter-associated beta strand repeat-containing protein [Planctomycetaceae bacterium]